MATTVTCTFCGKRRATEHAVVGGAATICDQCLWRFADELEGRGSVRPGSMTAPRVAACSLCDALAAEATVVGDLRVCGPCANAIAEFVLSATRSTLEEVWDVELPETTNIRRVTQGLAHEFRAGARTHAALAQDLAHCGDLGQALTEAAIALAADPADKVVLEQALGVLLGAAPVDIPTLRGQLTLRGRGKARRGP